MMVRFCFIAYHFFIFSKKTRNEQTNNNLGIYNRIYLISDIDISSFDALAIPGGFEVYGFYNDAYDDKFLDLIRGFKANNKFIASICVGALPLGKSGVLKDKKGTTYNSAVRRKALQGFGVNVINQPIVIDDNMITSWNPSTAVDVALLLLEHLTTKNNADKVRQLLGFDDKKN